MDNNAAIEKRYLETMYIVFHPDTGLITTEPYQEKALARALQLQALRPGKPVYIIQTDNIQRIDGDGKTKRIYKLERERLEITQEMV